MSYDPRLAAQVDRQVISTLKRWQDEMLAFPILKGLQPCRLALHTHCGSLGLFNPNARLITIHRVLCCHGDRQEVAITLCHELCHARQAPRDGDPHHPLWQAAMHAAGLDDTHLPIAGSPFARWWSCQDRGEVVITMHRDFAVTPSRRPF